MIIIDVYSEHKIIIINLYRSFRPLGMLSPRAFLKIQMDILKCALTSNCIILGDFKLDARMVGRSDYIIKQELIYFIT